MARRHPLAASKPEKKDMVLAFKALHVMPGLSPAARRVGAAILDHFNHDTGQCDPSQRRLADLLDLSIRRIKDSVKELAQPDDNRQALFPIVSHGGGAQRAFYAPNWAALREAAERWDAARKMPWRETEEVEEVVQEIAPQGCKKLHLGGAENCTQYSLTNQSKEPVESESASPEQAERPNGFGREQGAKRSVPSFIPSNGRSPSHLHVATKKASERLHRKLLSFGQAFYAAAIDLDALIWADALQREMDRPGSGSRFIIETMRQTGAAA